MQKKLKVVLLFDGQGSQYYSMGKDLFNTSAVFRNTLLELDATAYRVMGQSVIEHLYHTEDTVFDKLRLSHPALFMVQYALAMTLQEEFDIHPAYTLGIDVGEAVAAAVSGAIDPAEMLLAVIDQAAALEDHCEKGGMVTLLPTASDLKAPPETDKMYEAATLVTVNYCGHFTLSASVEALREIQHHLNSNGILYRHLPVNIALHSPLIDAAKNAFLESSGHLKPHKPQVPFISGIHARELHLLTPHYWWQTIREQTRFSDAIRLLESEGQYFYIDCSPLSALQGICKHIIPRGSHSAWFSIMNPAHEGMQNLQLLQRRPDLALPLIYRSSL